MSHHGTSRGTSRCRLVSPVFATTSGRALPCAGVSHGPSEKPAPERKPARHHRLVRPFAVIFGALSLWAVAPGALIWHQGAIDGARPSACAFVLGAAASHQKPSPVFEERIRHAVDLYGRGLVRTIVPADMAKAPPSSNPKSAATTPSAMAYPRRPSLSKRHRALPWEWENLTEAAEMMRQDHLATAIIVSDPLHLTRAGMMAKRLRIDAVTSPTPSTRFRSWRSRLHYSGA